MQHSHDETDTKEDPSEKSRSFVDAMKGFAEVLRAPAVTIIVTILTLTFAGVKIYWLHDRVERLHELERRRDFEQGYNQSKREVHLPLSAFDKEAYQEIDNTRKELISSLREEIHDKEQICAEALSTLSPRVTTPETQKHTK